MERVKAKYVIGLTTILFTAVLFADTIYLKNGLKIDGELIAVTADSVKIKTSDGQIAIAAVDVDKIETGKVELETKPDEPEPEMTVNVKQESIPTSIRQVGYGCLGGVVGLSVGSLIAMRSDDCMGGGELILVSIVVGIILGVVAGGVH